MTPEDRNQVLEWVTTEGWNLGIEDLDAFQIADPEGLLVACIGNTPVAAISAIKHADAFGFLGLYIVRQDLRGKGHGYPLWQAAMAYLDGCTIGLDAVVAQQENYSRSGFSIAHKNIRYHGIPDIDTTKNPKLHIIGADLIAAVLTYDQPFFPVCRHHFLRHWLQSHQHHAIAYVEDNRIKGYGVIRAAHSGYKIGPLFADDEAIATTIFHALCSKARGHSVVLDTPEPNHPATHLATSHGLSPLFETARMYRGTAPALPLGKIFGMSTLEIG